MHLLSTVQKYWFLIALAVITALTIADGTQTIAGAGRWLGGRGGPEWAVVLIFFLSGLMLELRQLQSGLQDAVATAATLALIFLVSPVVAALLGQFPMQTGVVVGLFIVAVMPSTLSSGVVMSGAAGGNAAHALFVTVLANALAVFTIPAALSLLLVLIGSQASVVIDKWSIVLKLGSYVMLPLAGGTVLRRFGGLALHRLLPKIQLINQFLVLGIIWMGLSQSREAIVTSGLSLVVIILLAFVFHATLLALAAIAARILKIGRGRRESLFFIGTQKTLPLSIILQVSLFPSFGLALVYCVVHHIVHLLMDGYLVGKMRS